MLGWNNLLPIGQSMLSLSQEWWEEISPGGSSGKRLAWSTRPFCVPGAIAPAHIEPPHSRELETSKLATTRILVSKLATARVLCFLSQPYRDPLPHCVPYFLFFIFIYLSFILNC